jgi:hypothetical protein
MDAEKETGRMTFNRRIAKIFGHPPTVARHQFPENKRFPGFFDVQKGLGYLKQLKITQKGFQKKMFVLDIETFPLFDTVVC